MVDDQNPVVVIDLDERRRAYLGKVGHREHSRYLATTHPDGTIVLVPAVVVPLSEVSEG